MNIYNPEILLWAIGVLQPVSVSDVIDFVSQIYPDIRPLPLIKDINKVFLRFLTVGYIVEVDRDSELYSLTHSGSMNIPLKLRRQRDKTRLFLLKNARKFRINTLGEGKKGLIGDSPITDSSSDIQDFPRQIDTIASPRCPRRSYSTYWPRVSKQLNFKVGLDLTSPNIFLKYYSYPSLDSIHEVSSDPAKGNDLSITDIALAIGISPSLVTSILHNIHEHYRSFEIGKRGGGKRTIDAPRIFLKVIQYFILDYILLPLKSHSICHSYTKGKSIITNATPHVNSAYVASIDITNFFGSITKEMTRDLLIENGFGNQISKTISRLTTLNNGLPQGAPTSPIISNAYLFNFDETASRICTQKDLKITRYADDITISGSQKKIILQVINIIENELLKLGLELNHKKTRIKNRGGQQRVTGLVVNDKVLPPKKLRKKIRAMFYNANKNPEEYYYQINKLKGYINYFSSFESMKSKDVKKYRDILNKIELTRRANEFLFDL